MLTLEALQQISAFDMSYYTKNTAYIMSCSLHTIQKYQLQFIGTSIFYNRIETNISLKKKLDELINLSKEIFIFYKLLKPTDSLRIIHFALHKGQKRVLYLYLYIFLSESLEIAELIQIHLSEATKFATKANVNYYKGRMK